MNDHRLQSKRLTTKSVPCRFLGEDSDVPAAAITSPAVTVPVSIEEHRAAVVQRRDEAERLGDDIAELAARIQAATYELLVMIRAFDEREGWSGFKSCAHWLNPHVGRRDPRRRAQDPHRPAGAAEGAAGA